MNTLAEFKAREVELREVTRKWIEAEDKKYREIEATNIAKANKPIRHPKGMDFDRTTRRFLWSDAIYCKDKGTEPFKMVFYPDTDPYEDDFFQLMMDSQGCTRANNKIDPKTKNPYWDEETVEAGETWDWLNNIFNEEFRKVCPDIQDVLEG